MKRYENELNRLAFDETTKQRMTRRLIAARQPAHRGRVFRRIAAVSAAAALCMTTGAAGALSLASHSPAFRDFFHISAAGQESMIGAAVLNTTFDDQNGSGASITIRDVTADGTALYVLMDFEAPAGVVLGERGSTADYTDYTLSNSFAEFEDPDFHSFFSAAFYSSESRSSRSSVPVTGGYSLRSLPDDDPTDNRIPMLFSYQTAENNFPEEIVCVEITDFTTLRGYDGGPDQAEILTGMDFDLIIPLDYTTPVYRFTGRRQASLGGVYPALIENLSISPYSLSFDVLIPDSDAYDAAYAAHGPWEMYVQLTDGAKVYGKLENPVAISSLYRDEKTKRDFFRVDHAHIMLESAIDPAKIETIRFVGDEEGAVMFAFDPDAFQNAAYWNEINELWRGAQNG